jgi:hypothetical protein
MLADAQAGPLAGRQERSPPLTKLEFATQSGEAPKNVLVSGSFALTPTSQETGFKTGVWTVTFASGTDLADAQAYTVDMMSGEVAVAPKQ